MKDLSKSLRLDYLQYKELLQITQLRSTGLSKDAEARLKRGEAINQLIIQDKNKPVSMEGEILYLSALNHGMLDKLSASQIERFKKEILSFVNKRHPEFAAEARKAQKLSDEFGKKLEDSLQEYFKKMTR